MSEYIKKAIEDLESKLQEQLGEVAETKKAINVLCRQLGEAPRFEDVSEEKASRMIRPDRFFNKPLSTAVREYLEVRGSAATVDEIYDALRKGGFEFVGKDESIKKRGLQISLTKNRKIFAYIKASDSFGLWEFYGGRPKEKQEGNADQERDTEANLVNDKKDNE
jgi:hypothetical protein